MILLQQLKLSIEESHSANDGNAQGGGEKHFVEHLFLIVSPLGLRQLVSTCCSSYKPEWSENRQARPTDSNQLCCSRSQRKAAHNLAVTPATTTGRLRSMHCSRSRRKSTSKPAGTNNLAAPGTQKLSHCNNTSLISLVVNIAAIPS